MKRSRTGVERKKKVQIFKEKTQRKVKFIVTKT